MLSAQICGRNLLDPEDAAQQAEHMEQLKQS